MKNSKGEIIIESKMLCFGVIKTIDGDGKEWIELDIDIPLRDGTEKLTINGKEYDMKSLPIGGKYKSKTRHAHQS